MSPLLAVLLAALAGTTAPNLQWTERYFGVGSAEEQAMACKAAKGHADGNSINACADRRGVRTEAQFTECMCSAVADREHVCNVNLKVVCDASASGAAIPGTGSDRGGELKGRAGRVGTGRGPRVRGRPGLEASKHPLEASWSAARP
jgi:hypothetical protein